MITKTNSLLIICIAILSVVACENENNILKDETPYILTYGDMPDPNLPSDNVLTTQGVQLGRMLFYETMLSKDGSQSCATCHVQQDGFSDKRRFSLGVENLPGKRQAMPVFNMAWHDNEFFWDGRATLLRDQALLPIQDPLEMNETLDNVITKLSDTKDYRRQFALTFGSTEVTAEKISLALEQFMLSIVSFNSKYDKYLSGEVQLSDSEERGRALFFTEFNPFFPDQSGADCAHCHGGRNFENDDYMNNGLDTDADMTDIGREAVTNDPNDRGKFKVPTLRNITITAPYMHDGRFQTLEEVIEHYNSGIKSSATADHTVINTQSTGLFLDAQDKQDLLNFLHTLTDDTFLNNAAYTSPF